QGGWPKQLLHNTTPNLKTAQLIALFERYFNQIIASLEKCNLVELQENVVIPHIESRKYE
ncbi:MAG: hypothetical protein LBB58_01660, partial [Cellulomonadaceae bacterium]|nr:hypothetical protein [Cellulomonadaceae bacterium]